jgi:protein-S-isoprenylcysteine O-methyltransferase Ste14
MVGLVLLKMSYGYTQKRAYRRYAIGKTQAPSIRSFTRLSKVLFISSMAITLTSYWFSLSWMLLVYRSPAVALAGAVMVVLGYWGLSVSFKQLGQNYSPLFDAYAPLEIVTQGVYGHIRHPIYLFNLFVSFGLALSSGSAVVLACSLTGLGFILRAIHIEEHYLKQAFPQYGPYCARTWRLVPYLF